MCQQLRISASGYYAWRNRGNSQRSREDTSLSDDIKRIYEETHGIYGYRRLHQALLALGKHVRQRRTARLMRQLGMKGRQYRRYVVTTKPGRRLPEVPDLVQRDFTADAPNRVWLADITYIRTGEGWLYLAAVIDLFSRCIVGWAMGPRLTNDLTLQALEMALDRRQPPQNLIHHSDRGTQYISAA